MSLRELLTARDETIRADLLDHTGGETQPFRVGKRILWTLAWLSHLLFADGREAAAHQSPFPVIQALSWHSEGAYQGLPFYGTFEVALTENLPSTRCRTCSKPDKGVQIGHS